MGKLHSSYRWQKRRAQQLRDEPLCRMCSALNKITAADTVDHVVPHRGDERLFWEGELASLCASCHSSLKQQIEKSGTFRGCDVNGYPLDDSHWWKRK